MELQTDRLLLKKLSKDDFEKVYSLQSNPDVMRYIGNGTKTKQQSIDMFELLLKHQDKHGFTICPVYEKETGHFIGFAGLIYLALDDSNSEIEVAYWLLPEFWGKGYALQLTKACINWAFENLHFTLVVGVTHPDNIRSQNILLKAGLQNIGEWTYRGNEVIRFEIKKKIVWDDFTKVELRVGTIIEAIPFPEAHQLAYKLKVDLGKELGIKKSSAQITKLYRMNELIGKQVLCVTNFFPKQIGPYISEVLVTGFVLNNEVVLCRPDKEIPNGTRLL